MHVCVILVGRNPHSESIDQSEEKSSFLNPISLPPSLPPSFRPSLL